MRQAKFIAEISVIDPDTQGTVDIEVYKHPNGGIFAMDSSFLESICDDESDPVITDPFDLSAESAESDVAIDGLYDYSNLIRLTDNECNF